MLNCSGLSFKLFFYCVTDGYLTLLVCVFGIVVNLVCLLMFLFQGSSPMINRRSSSSGITTFIAVLLLCDLIQLCWGVCTGFLRFLFYVWSDAEVDLASIRWHIRFDTVIYWIMQVLYPPTMISYYCSMWITMAICLLRYVAVCHPFRASSASWMHRSNVIVLLIVLLATVINIPRFIDREIVNIRWNVAGANLTTVRFVSSQFGKSAVYRVVSEGLYILLIYLAPMLILSYCYSRILKELKLSCVTHILPFSSRIKRGHRAERQGAVILVMLTVTFYVCQTMAMVEHAMFMCTGRYVSGLTVSVSNVLILFNAAVNPFFYFLFSKKFQEACKLLHKDSFSLLLSKSRSPKMMRRLIKGQNSIIVQHSDPIFLDNNRNMNRMRGCSDMAIRCHSVDSDRGASPMPYAPERAVLLEEN